MRQKQRRGKRALGENEVYLELWRTGKIWAGTDYAERASPLISNVPERAQQLQRRKGYCFFHGPRRHGLQAHGIGLYVGPRTGLFWGGAGANGYHGAAAHKKADVSGAFLRVWALTQGNACPESVISVFSPPRTAFLWQYLFVKDSLSTIYHYRPFSFSISFWWWFS